MDIILYSHKLSKMSKSVVEYIDNAPLNTILTEIDTEIYLSLPSASQRKITIIPKGIVNVYLKTTHSDHEIKKEKKKAEAEVMIDMAGAGEFITMDRDIYLMLNKAYTDKLSRISLPADEKQLFSKR